MSDSPLLSVAEAADRLHLSRARVHQLINRKVLNARKVGSQLVIEEDALRAIVRKRSAGRPVSAAVSWGMAFAAAGVPAPWLSAVQRSRASRLVRDNGFVEAREKLARRATIARYRTGERGQRIVRECAASRPAGSSLASELSLDLLVPDVVEIYLPREEMHELVRLSPLRPDLAQPNVILHVIDDEIWEAIAALDRLPPAAVASDLIELGFLLESDRWQRAGWDLLERSWPSSGAR